MKLGLFPKHKSEHMSPEVVSTQKSSPIYLIGFLIIMLFALVLHFLPQKSSDTGSVVEPEVRAVPPETV